MCDFHSVIVTGDGRILHNASNSHSNIAHANDLDMGLDAKWWECEWNGEGDFPSTLIQTRGKNSVPTSLAHRVAESHYRKLALIVAGELDPHITSPFNLDEYVDVRNRYNNALAEQRAVSIADQFEELSHGAQIAFVRALTSEFGLDMEEVASDEIEVARQDGYEEGQEAGSDSSYQAGYESASEELYSYEYMQEEIENAVEKAKEEWEAENAYDEGYEAGYMDCKRGKAPACDFVGGMPSFLL